MNVYTLHTKLPPLLDHTRSHINEADCYRSIVANFTNFRDNRITIIVDDWQFCYRIDPDGLFGTRNGRIDKNTLSKRAPISVRFLLSLRS